MTNAIISHSVYTVSTALFFFPLHFYRIQLKGFSFYVLKQNHLWLPLYHHRSEKKTTLFNSSNMSSTTISHVTALALAFSDTAQATTTINHQQQSSTAVVRHLLPQKPVSPKSRIINGHQAKKGQYKFYTALEQPKEVQSFVCGGSIIDPLWILTAAHCSVDQAGAVAPAASSYQARVSAYNYNDFGDHSGEELRPITRYLNHPMWSTKTLEYDYSLYTWTAPITTVAPIVLFNADIYIANISTTSSGALTIIGLGTTQQKPFPENPSVLQQALMDFIPESKCKGSQTQAIYFDHMLCAWGSGGGDGNLAAGACFGDSGGPLFFTDSQGAMKQVGLVSWGPDTCRAAPTIFAKMTPEIVGGFIGTHVPTYNPGNSTPTSNSTNSTPAPSTPAPLTTTHEPTDEPANEI